MAEPLTPLSLPPTPPELGATALALGGPIRTWTGRMTDWTTQIVRVLKDNWTKLLAQINGLLSRMDAVETRLTTLEGRQKDNYTFTVVGTLAVLVNATQVALVVREAGTLVEAFAYVGTAPTGAALIVDVNKNGVTLFSGTKLQVAAGTQTGTQTAFTSPALVVGDVLTVDIDAVGSITPGANLTIHLKVR